MVSPIDPRLLRQVPPVRGLIVRAGVFQGALTILILGRGVLLGIIAAHTIEGMVVDPWLWWLGAAIALHGPLAWLQRRSSSRAVGTVIDTLREQSIIALSHRDPRVVEEEAATWRHILTRGMEDFRPYLSEFLPSLIALVVSTPVALLTIFYFDWISAFSAFITLPLIPAFMVLIGRLTAARTKRRLATTAALGQQLDDLLSGAPTLRALHATQQPAAQIRKIGARHQKTTMGVLRIAFLSSFALEFLATLSVALVAVSIGLRLVYGELPLLPGLVVLIIVPEVFGPIRRVGSNFHAAANGLEAVGEVLALIEETPRVKGAYRRIGGTGVHAQNLSIRGRDGLHPADLTFTARPGEITTLTGPNGAGKSTIFLAALACLPDAQITGSISVGGKIGFAPARPVTVPGTVETNLTLFGATTSGAKGFEIGVPLDHRIGPNAEGISSGQLQRLGLARVLASDSDVLLLDEPTAHLSPELVEALLVRLRAAAAAGHTVVVATHDARVLEAADQVVNV